MKDHTWDPKAGVWDTAINIVATVVGVGLLGNPILFAEVGWVMGPIFFFFAAALTIYCGMLLSKCANVDVPYGYPPIEHNHEVGERAMGRTGVILAMVGNHTTSVMVATLFIITGADEMATIFGENTLNRYAYAVIFYLIILPPVYFKNMSHVAALGWLGSAASVLVFCVAIVKEFLFLSSDEYSAGEEYAKPAFASKDPLVYVAVLSGSYFSYGAAVIFTESNYNIVDPEVNFPKAVALGIGITTSLYLVLCLVCYGVQGVYLQDQENVLDALPQGWSVKFVSAVFLVHLLSAANIVMNPVFTTCEDVFELETRFGRARGEIVRCVFRILCFTGCLIVALAIPFFSDMMSLVGATSVTMSNYINPCLFYLKLFWEEPGPPQAGGEWGEEQKGLVNVSGGEYAREYGVEEEETEEGDGEMRFVGRRKISTQEKYFLIGIIAFSVLVGLFATYQAIDDIVKEYQDDTDSGVYQMEA